MNHPSIRRRALSTLFALFLVAGCSGSRDDSLGTQNIGRTDGAIVTDEDAEVDDEGEDGGGDDNGGDDGGGEEIDAGEADAGDFDAIVSVEVADAGEAPDSTVIVETALCGNGQVDPDEQCDQGASNSDSVAGACRLNCRNAHCGDGVVDQGEACDQGASNSDGEPNACRANCTAARCGDSVVDQGEQCDTGDTRSDTAAGACRLACRSARCGDSVRDTDEGCDDGNTVDTDACRNNCRSARCGDGVLDPDEECDDGNTVNTDACRDTCRRPICGDRVVDSGEQCDDGNQVNNDGCRSNCRTGCANDAACSDNLFCTGVERCVDGLCNPGVGINPDDNIGCTMDVCREDLDRVVHTPTDSLCVPPAPTCSGARGTTRTSTCNATSGCVERVTSTACSDEPSACELRGDGSYTLATYMPACENTMSCGDANRVSQVCAHIPASCNNGVFTGRANATCNPNAETCGNQTPATDNCATRNSSSCAAGNTSFTRVTGTCSTTGCGASTTTSPCPDPADSCTNAHRRTYEPTCNATSGCGTERVVVDVDCTARGAACVTDANQTPAVQRYRAECDPNNLGQCVGGGTPQALETCQGRGAICSTPVGAGPSVTTYGASCSGGGCVDGGVAQGNPVACTAQSSSCGPNPDSPRLPPRQTTYAPACQSGTSCLPGGRPTTADCGAAAASCQADGQGRAFRTSYTPACNTANTLCLANGAATQTFCDQEPTFCNASGQPVDTINQCSNGACAQSVGTACPTNQRSVCASRTLRRVQQGGCLYGTGCTYTDTATAETCAAPQCVNLGSTAASCGGCGANADGAITCSAACVACPNGCSGGVCNIRVTTPLPGGVISPGGIVTQGDTVAPGAGVLSL